MSPDFILRVVLRSPDETSVFARALAHRLKPGDTIALGGAIGAGKTHFARALIQARLAIAGRMEDVPSPTFTLVQTYDDGITEIWHADLYRLSSPDELLELGLDEAFADGIVLIEWPDRAAGLIPDDALHLTFEPTGSGDARTLVIRSHDARWRPLVSDAVSQIPGVVLA